MATCICFVSLYIQAVSAQQYVTFPVNQPDSLQADAGDDVIEPPSTVVTLGGDPAASGGTPPYTYNWSPAYNLSDTTVANPSLNVDSALTYTLQVTGANGCTDQSSVKVELQTGITDAAAKMESFQVLPNPIENNGFTLHAKGVKGSYRLRVINVSGQEIINKRLSGEGKQQIRIPEDVFSKGLLIIEIQASSTHTIKTIRL
ncbi:MAG: hypothetical protein R6U19_01290 [Bacteroidales bacterium]